MSRVAVIVALLLGGLPASATEDPLGVERYIEPGMSPPMQSEVGPRSLTGPSLMNPTTLNGFVYANGNPLKYTDPNGMVAIVADLTSTDPATQLSPVSWQTTEGDTWGKIAADMGLSPNDLNVLMAANHNLAPAATQSLPLAVNVADSLRPGQTFTIPPQINGARLRVIEAAVSRLQSTFWAKHATEGPYSGLKDQWRCSAFVADCYEAAHAPSLLGPNGSVRSAERLYHLDDRSFSVSDNTSTALPGDAIPFIAPGEGYRPPPGSDARGFPATTGHAVISLGNIHLYMKGLFGTVTRDSGDVIYAAEYQVKVYPEYKMQQFETKELRNHLRIFSEHGDIAHINNILDRISAPRDSDLDLVMAPSRVLHIRDVP